MCYSLKRNSVYTCLKLPGSRRGWNVFSIDSLRGSGRGPCLGPVCSYSGSKSAPIGLRQYTQDAGLVLLLGTSHWQG